MTGGDELEAVEPTPRGGEDPDEGGVQLLPARPEHIHALRAVSRSQQHHFPGVTDENIVVVLGETFSMVKYPGNYILIESGNKYEWLL